MNATGLTHPTDLNDRPVRAKPLFPRAVLVAAACIVGLTLLAVSTLRLTGFDPAQAPAAVVVERRLVFADASDGAVQVKDAVSGEAVARMAGEQGFLRGVLRGLARERKRNELGSEQPFELIGRADGRLTLRDPATGRLVDLESFGPTNAAVFARLLTAAPQRP
jgi:putative photosynthetic complex assembly protein